MNADRNTDATDDCDTSQQCEIRLLVNGVEHRANVSAHDSLATVLRDHLNLKGTKIGCNAGECGACTIILDDRAVCACLVPALRAQGSSIRTIEGEGRPESLSRIQQALLDHGAIQCGFCTPGVVMSLAALFQRHPSPVEQQIRIALQGNVCRCSGYTKIIEAAKSLVEGPV